MGKSKDKKRSRKSPKDEKVEQQQQEEQQEEDIDFDNYAIKFSVEDFSAWGFGECSITKDELEKDVQRILSESEATKKSLKRALIAEFGTEYLKTHRGNIHITLHKEKELQVDATAQ